MLVATVEIRIEENEGVDLTDKQQEAIADALEARDWEEVVEQDLRDKLGDDLMDQVCITRKW